MADIVNNSKDAKNRAENEGEGVVNEYHFN
jgi:hypothetical protein